MARSPLAFTSDRKELCNGYQQDHRALECWLLGIPVAG